LALSAAALAFGNTPETVLTKGSGSRKNAPARQCGMYLACVYLGLPVALVARCFRRAPSAVHHACRTIEDAREDHDFERFISTLESGLRIWVRHYGPAQGEQNHD
jgi:chromosomal replication initiation ATPase DnaA